MFPSMPALFRDEDSMTRMEERDDGGGRRRGELMLLCMYALPIANLPFLEYSRSRRMGVPVVSGLFHGDIGLVATPL